MQCFAKIYTLNGSLYFGYGFLYELSDKTVLISFKAEVVIPLHLKVGLMVAVKFKLLFYTSSQPCTSLVLSNF